MAEVCGMCLLQGTLTEWYFNKWMGKDGNSVVVWRRIVYCGEQF